MAIHNTRQNDILAFSEYIRYYSYEIHIHGCYLPVNIMLPVQENRGIWRHNPRSWHLHDVTAQC